MLNDMLLGQYVDRNSVIHRLWAGTKLIAVFALAIALVLLRWTPGYLVCFALLVLTVAIARLPAGYLWRSSRIVIIILFIGMLPTLFFAEGDDPTRVVFGIWTVEGVRRSIRIFSMLGLIFLNAKVLMMTTRTVDVIDALAVLLGPLRRIRLPVDELVMTTALALRFIPLMADEMTKLVRAQQARGGLARRDFGGQAQMLLGLVMPLLNNNLERSEELATAMEARGYAGGPWVNPSPLRLRPLDIVVIIVILALSLALSITRWTATPWP